MQTKDLHSWNLSYSQARDCQKNLASKVQLVPLKKPPKLIAGIDCAFSKDGKKIIAAVVVLRSQKPEIRCQSYGLLTEKPDSPPSVLCPPFSVIETTTASRKVTFPYIPGLLSFREAPVCIAAAEKLKTVPDVFIIDGQGIAHPRRLGLAAHLGLFFDKPTIGCAKSRLTGRFEEPPLQKGGYSLLKDKTTDERQATRPVRSRRLTSNGASDETIGAVVRTRTNVKPLFISVGNKCLLKDAIEITLACTTKYRLPEPTRLAHQLVSKLRLKG